ncbi:MAG: methionine ABC transporter permease [Butyribacter sp.]|nr:ABC transporter permease [bacterium]MDY3854854.1 methionine ABC transporter permease [Butyribacter sp.]
MIGNGVWETIQMTLIATAFAYLLGLPLGIILVVTAKGNILENRIVNGIIGAIVNIFRSVPFLILLVLLIPITRLLVGTSIGTTATIVPLTVGAIPIVARMVESSLTEVPGGIIEAAQSMGASPLKIILFFLLPEAMPSLILGTAINLATVLGYSAMAGFVGGGGLGAIAIQYGYYRYQTDVLLITVLILIIIVQIFQEAGNRLSAARRHS